MIMLACFLVTSGSDYWYTLILNHHSLFALLYGFSELKLNVIIAYPAARCFFITCQVLSAGDSWLSKAMILTGKEPDENSDFDEIGTCVSQILLGSYYQLNYEATCWMQGTFQRVLLSCGGIWYNFEIYFIINCSFLIDEKCQVSVPV